RTEVQSGGTLHVATGGVANDTTVNSGGLLETEVQAKLNNLLAKGGAILDLDAGTVLTGDVIIDANADLQGEYDYDNIFKKESVETGSLTLVGGLNNKLEAEALVNTVEDKSLKLTNGKYNIGDGYQAVSGWDELVIKDNAEVKLEGDVKLANASKNIKLLDGSELNLAGHSPGYYEIVGSLNNDGNINFSHENDKADDVTKLFGNYKAFANAKMTIDVDPDANVSDVLMVEGDVEGTTKLTINPMSGNQASDKILFVSAPNDLNSTPAYFEVFRVIGDAQVWNVLHENNNWYVGTSNVIADADKNGYGDKADLGDLSDDDAFVDAVLPPNFGSGINNANKGNKKPAKKTEVYAEAMAYAAVAGAGLEQTKSVTDSVANNVEATKYFHKICGGYYDCYYDKNPLRNSWVAPVYARAEVNAPVDFEADIWGLEGGFDLQSDVYNRLGVFVSYRQGEYEVSGEGDEIFSKTKSDIDIDSYLAGLYYRYDKGRVYALATLFGGWQDVDISTIDGVKSDTNGWQMGASMESGLMFRQSRTMFVQPFVKLGYNQINYNNARDHYGKKADIGDVKNMDVELGVKFDKKIWFEKDMQARIYLKPSVVQSIGDANMKVSGVDKVDTLNDKTIAKIDFGGSFDLDNGWSGFADLSHAFGDDYENTSFNVGAKYSW
ncbi:MAG: autotransporter outer membrane beta-barrel domain-containing protein, partial [Alphaproteobacteria bacterium]|nr:autotransporter outer membrane beta-barrel domain-containing protein [Alphaproteobacteria bacterium]